MTHRSPRRGLRLPLPLVFLAALLGTFHGIQATTSPSPAEAFRAYNEAILRARQLSDLDLHVVRRGITQRAMLIKALSGQSRHPREIEDMLLGIIQKETRSLELKLVREDQAQLRSQLQHDGQRAYLLVDAVDLNTGAATRIEPVMEWEEGAWKYAGRRGALTDGTPPIAPYKPDLKPSIPRTPPADNQRASP